MADPKIINRAGTPLAMGNGLPVLEVASPSPAARGSRVPEGIKQIQRILHGKTAALTIAAQDLGLFHTALSSPPHLTHDYGSFILQMTGTSGSPPRFMIQGSLDPGDALKLMIIYGPRYHLVASVLNNSEDFSPPHFISGNLNPDIRTWVQGLTPSEKNKALILILEAQRGQNGPLAALIRHLATSPPPPGLPKLLDHLLSTLCPEMTPRSAGTPPSTPNPEADPERIAAFYGSLVRNGIKPSAFASLRAIRDPQAILSGLKNFLDRADYSEERKFLAALISKKKEWPEPMRMVGVELVLFFAPEKKDLERLKWLVLHGKDTDEAAHLYRTLRPQGTWVMESLRNGDPGIRHPLEKPLIGWKTEAIQNLLNELTQILDVRRAAYLHQLCDDVFGSGSYPEKAILSALGWLRQQSGLASKLDRLSLQGPLTLEEKRQWLITHDYWRIRHLRGKYAQWLRVEGEGFPPLKAHLQRVVEALVGLEGPEGAAQKLWRGLSQQARTRKAHKGLPRFLLAMLSGMKEPERFLVQILEKLIQTPELWAQREMHDKKQPTSEAAWELYRRVTDPQNWKILLPASTREYFHSLARGEPHEALKMQARRKFDYYLTANVGRIARAAGMAADEPALLAAPDPTAFFALLPPAAAKEAMKASKQDINVQYSMALDPLAAAEAVSYLARMFKGLPSKGRDFLRRQLAQWTKTAEDVLSVVYWARSASLNGPGFQEAVAQAVQDYARHMDVLSVRVSGNILHKFVDPKNHALEEVLASAFHARRGDDVHFVPDVLKRELAIPDLMIISPEGSLRLIEAKKIAWGAPQGRALLYQYLEKAHKQLMLFAGYPRVRRVIHLRVYVHDFNLKQDFLGTLKEFLESGSFPLFDEAVVLMNQIRRSQTPDLFRTPVFRAVLHPEPEQTLAYGGQKAERTAKYMQNHGVINWQEYPFAQAILAMKDAEGIQSLSGEQLKAEVRTVTAPYRKRSATITLPHRSTSAHFKRIGTVHAPVFHSGLSPFFNSLGVVPMLRG